MTDIRDLETLEGDSLEHAPAKARRIHAFAGFFKNYMSVSAVVAAALPIPAASFHLIPTYESQTKLLSTYSTLFCFLTLACLFYNRHTLARSMFREWVGKPPPEVTARVGSGMVFEANTTADEIEAFRQAEMERVVRRYRAVGTGSRFALGPLLLIFISVGFVFSYHEVYARSLIEAKGVATDPFRLHSVTRIFSDGSLLLVCYLGIFVLAEAAFIIMAIKEYMQDVLNLSDTDIIKGPEAQKSLKH